MNKFLKPLIFLLIAASAVGVMYYINWKDKPTEEVVISNTPETYKEIQLKCDNLGKNPWNAENYKAIKRLIETSSTGHSTISTDEASTLKNSLEQQYAESMVRSYKNWLVSLGTTNIKDVYNIMITQANIDGCKVILDRPINVIKKHDLALGIPSMIESFKHQKFNFDRYNEINNLILECCVNTPEIVSFTDIKSINNSSITSLSAFKRYGSDFNEKLDWIISHPDDKVAQLAKYCTENGNTDTFNYEWYFKYLSENSVCN